MGRRKLKIEYEPTERQRAFHTCPADEVLYGGAAGGGKTLGLLMDMVAHCLEFPGAHAVIFRRTYPELEKGIILEALRRLPQSKVGRGGWTGVWQYNKAERRGYFPNGSILEFCHLETEEDVFQHQGAEYTRIGFDELTHFTEFMYVYMLSRLRSTNPQVKPQIRATTNPGGIGHRWVKKRFIDPAPPGTIFVPEATELERQYGVEPLSRCFIPAKLKHNPHIPKTYIANLLALPERQRRALLDGDWDAYEGQAFPEWRRDLHVVKWQKLPEEWLRFRAIDYGWTRPMVCLWFAVDPHGTVWVYRELAMKHTRVAEFAQRIESFGEKIEYTVLDPSAWAKSGSGDSIADLFQRAGVAVIRGNSDRLAGKQKVHELLAPAQHPDGVERPRLLIMDSCVGLIEAMGSLPLSKANPEDVDTDAEGDDYYDALRYGVMSRYEGEAGVAVATDDWQRSGEKGDTLVSLLSRLRREREEREEIAWMSREF